MKQQINLFKEKLGDCKGNKFAKCEVRSSYEVINFQKFFIVDQKGEQPVKVLSNNENQKCDLTVENSRRLNICLIKTDNCLFTKDHQKCDCILFNSNKIFLVELSTAQNRTAKRKDAIMQLKATIKKLKEKNITLPSYDKKAIICFRTPKSRTTQSASNSKRDEFFQDTGYKLDDDNKIVF